MQRRDTFSNFSLCDSDFDSNDDALGKARKKRKAVRLIVANLVPPKKYAAKIDFAGMNGRIYFGCWPKFNSSVKLNFKHG